jgi:hypothetical protein
MLCARLKCRFDSDKETERSVHGHGLSVGNGTVVALAFRTHVRGSLAPIKLAHISVHESHEIKHSRNDMNHTTCFVQVRILWRDYWPRIH